LALDFFFLSSSQLNWLTRVQQLLEPAQGREQACGLGAETLLSVGVSNAIGSATAHNFTQG